MLTANKTRRSDNAEYQVLRKAESLAFVSPSPTYPFSFPLCDLLICEFAAEETSVTELYISPKRTLHLNARAATPSPKMPVAVRGIVSVAEYVFQKVIRRKPVPFIHSEADLKNLGCYVKETLACGHVIDVHPSEIEPLTAIKRNCHECAGWYGGLQLKKPVQKVTGESRRKKQAGHSWWPATACATVLIVAGGLWLHARWPKSYFYSYPDNYLRIVQNVDPCLADGSCGYRFVVQAVVDGTALPETEMHFCAKGIQPRFENGHVLSWIRYTSVGSCLSIDGFDVVRDSARNPVLADNCKPDYSLAKDAGHINCEGGRAKF